MLIRVPGHDEYYWTENIFFYSDGISQPITMIFKYDIGKDLILGKPKNPLSLHNAVLSYSFTDSAKHVCETWKPRVYTLKRGIMIFRKGF